MCNSFRNELLFQSLLILLQFLSFWYNHIYICHFYFQTRVDKRFLESAFLSKIENIKSINLYDCAKMRVSFPCQITNFNVYYKIIVHYGISYVANLHYTTFCCFYNHVGIQNDKPF